MTKEKLEENISADKIGEVAKAAFFVPSILVLLQLAGIYLPEHFAWGFDFWRYLPSPINELTLMVALIFTLQPVIKRTDQFVLALEQTGNEIAEQFKPKRLLSGALISVLLFVILFVLRTKSHLYGDGYLEIEKAMVPFTQVSNWDFYLQIGAKLTNRIAISIFHKSFSLSPAASIAVIKSFGGVIGIWALYKIPRLLTKDKRTRIFIFIGSLSSGATILFFGFIENYTWATALALWSLFWTLKYLKNKSSLLPGIIFGLAAVFFHAVILPFLLVAGLAYFVKNFCPKKISYYRFIIVINLLALFGAIAVALIFQESSLPQLFTPIASFTLMPYTAFSPAHLLDFLNVILLTAPVGIVFLLLLLPAVIRQVKKANAIESILIILAFYTTLAVFWINPELGAPRDWDLLSQCGFPLTILGLYYFTRLAVSGKSLPVHWLLSITIIVSITIIPNLIEKNRPSVAAGRLDTILYDDAHYHSDYKLAERCLSWANLLESYNEDKTKPIKYFRRYLETNLPYFDDMGSGQGNYINIWMRLGEHYLSAGQTDSARYCFKRAAELNPDNLRVLIRTAYVEMTQHDYASALKYLSQANRVDPANPQIIYYISEVYKNMGRYDESIEFLRRAVGIAPNSFEINFAMGQYFANKSNADSTYYYLKQSEMYHNGGLPDFESYRALFISTLALKKYDEAEQLLNKLSKSNAPKQRVDSLKQMFPERKK